MKNQKVGFVLDSPPVQELEQKRVYCSQKNQAFQLCMNEKCNESAFICIDEKCSCNKKHLPCPQILIKSIHNSIKAKTKPIKEIQEQILKQIQKTIHQLSDFKDKITTQFESVFKYSDLSTNDQKFIDLINYQSSETLTGKKVFQMLKLMNNQQLPTKSGKFTKQFTKIWESLNAQIKSKMNQISKMLEDLKQKKQFAFFNDSKIIESEQSINRIRNFFGLKNLIQTKLLYQTLSRNYSIDQFHNKCDNIPHTLTICETEFGKVIGGYTPLIWNKKIFDLTESDPSGDSFIFSLTNNHKLKLDKNKSAISHCHPHGPLFGGGNSDFAISKPGSPSWTLVGGSYINEQYPGNGDSYEKFNGNPGKSHYFNINKWQVWQIKLSQ